MFKGFIIMVLINIGIEELMMIFIVVIVLMILLWWLVNKVLLVNVINNGNK